MKRTNFLHCSRRILVTTGMLFPALFGCTKSAEKPGQAVQGPVPFERVRALSDRYCVRCHHVRSSINPYNFQSDQEMRDQAAFIADRVRSGSMPPVGSPQMTPREQNDFVRWAEDQAEQNKKDRLPAGP